MDKFKVDKAAEVINAEKFLWGYRIEKNVLQRRKETSAAGKVDKEYEWIDYGDKNVHKTWFLRPPRSKWKKRLSVRYVILFVHLGRAPTWAEYNSNPEDYSATDFLGKGLTNVAASLSQMGKMSEDQFTEVVKRSNSGGLYSGDQLKVVYDNMHTARPAYMPVDLKTGLSTIYLDPYSYYRSALFIRATGITLKMLRAKFKLVKGTDESLFKFNPMSGDWEPMPWDFTGLVKLHYKMDQHPEHRGGVSIPARYIAAAIHYGRFPTMNEYMEIDVILDDTFKWTSILATASFNGDSTPYDIEDFAKDLFNPDVPLARVSTCNG